MFVPIPTRVRQEKASRRKPYANGCIVALNVLLFVLGGASSWYIGYDGHGCFSVVSYGFAHASPWHLIGNMYILLMIGNPVNRRIGNLNYTLAYFGATLALGLIGWLTGLQPLMGSSGAIFAITALFLMLMPAAIVDFSYISLFPVTVLIGLVQKPKEFSNWFIHWGRFSARAWLFLFLIPILEVWGFLMWRISTGVWPWTHPAHLIGFLVGVIIVLMLPTRITMGHAFRS